MTARWRDSGEIVRAIGAGEVTCVEVVETYLEVIAAQEPAVGAWTVVDADHAIAQARRLDATTMTGPLHGVPIGVKDIIDTADLPTTYNSPIYEGNRPVRDAACVSLARSAGAIVLGKTQTVEFASLGRVPDSRNPHDPQRTPGGSSTGSGAAVGAGMVPLAFGTQTGGSTIRPASFCGVAGMKPTYGLVSPEGIKVYAPSLDTIGWIGGTVADLVQMSLAMGVIDAPPRPQRHFKLGFYRTPHWSLADDDCRHVVEGAASTLAANGIDVVEITGPSWFERLTEAQDVIMHWEGRAAYRPEQHREPDLLHPNFHDEVANIKGRTHDQVRRAYDDLGRARHEWEQAIDGYDAVLTPAVLGQAPLGLSETGMATFNRMFTALHGPNVTVPAGSGDEGLPIGVQFVGRRFDDNRVLGVAVVAESLLSR